VALPHPINGAEEYLRAIHDELKLIRALLQPKEADQPQPGDIVQLREPQKSKRKG
jgi:hypothetical protein